MIKFDKDGIVVNLYSVRRILIIAMYLVAGVLLLIMLYDLQVGNIVPGVKGGTPTVPHQAYFLVLPALLHLIYKTLKGEYWWSNWS